MTKKWVKERWLCNQCDQCCEIVIPDVLSLPERCHPSRVERKPAWYMADKQPTIAEDGTAPNRGGGAQMSEKAEYLCMDIRCHTDCPHYYDDKCNLQQDKEREHAKKVGT